MDLRTGTPLWTREAPPRFRTTPLRKDCRCDVAIIGAGITGALVAHRLVQSGLKVVMLDSRDAGRGSTAASTGLLLYQPDTSVAFLTRRHGRRVARRVYTLGRKAIAELGRLSRSLDRACGFSARRTLYVATRPEDATKLRAEARRTRGIGFDVAYVSAGDLKRRFQIARPGALAAAGAAQVNAFRLTHGVIGWCRRQPGFTLHQRTRVKTIRENERSVTLTTHGGAKVHAAHVIVAAGYESMRFLGPCRLVRLHSTYVIASRPLSPASLGRVRRLMWETARPYFYLRTTPDRRLVFGGADEPFAAPARRDRQLGRKVRELEEQWASLFPDLPFRTEYAWTGTFAETTDGLPCIGPKRRGSRILYALGYGGNGITFSQIAARLLHDVCRGRVNRDAALFSFDRGPSRRRR